jgi:hypothetical protein
MKKIITAVASVAAMVVATPAWADDANTGPDTTTITVNGNNPAKCNLTAAGNTVTLPGNRLSNNDGFATSDVGTLIANALNGLSMAAWCTGASNSVSLSRTTLARVGTNGGESPEGFNQAVIYDLAMAIAGTGGAAPSGNNGNGNGGGNGNGNNGCGNGNGGPSNPANCGLNISTANGIGTGTATRFGPTGNGNAVTFSAVGSSNATAVAGSGTGARALFASDPSRLAAGDYTGLVTVTLTPGV